jgi:hypothetical protein
VQTFPLDTAGHLLLRNGTGLDAKPINYSAPFHWKIRNRMPQATNRPRDILGRIGMIRAPDAAAVAGGQQAGHLLRVIFPLQSPLAIDEGSSPIPIRSPLP